LTLVSIPSSDIQPVTSLLISFISFMMIRMGRKEKTTTITISRTHYQELQELGRKNETFDQIVGNLLKSAKVVETG
jgi:hypothetical protein